MHLKANRLKMTKSTKPLSNVKHTIKYLAHCKNPSVCKAVLKDSPDNVIKCVCNAALNACRGDIKLTKKQKRILSQNKVSLSRLVDPHRSIKQKRKIINQKGGIGFIPLLLSTVLGTIGSALFNRITGNNNASNG